MDKEIDDQVDNLIMDMLMKESSPIQSSSSSSSSNDDEPPRKIVRRERIENYVENVIPGYNEAVFKQHFRISRTVVYRLIDRLRLRTTEFVATHTHGMKKISPEKSFLLALWYLSNLETFRQIADRFNVTESSAHRVLLRMLNFLLSIKHETIKWPTNLAKEEISEGFKSKQGIKGIVGAIDGCHIRINRPQKHEDSYVNRKGYHSLLLQGIVDHQKRFIDVFCGEPGSLHDARLLRKSAIFSKAAEPDFFGNYFLLGDSAYPVLPWLIPPFRDNGALTERQKIFNFRLSSTRITVEHAFGLLKGRFRRLRHLDNSDIKTSVKCIMASCILHNICLNNNDTLNEPIEENEEIDDATVQPGPSQVVIEKDERRRQIFDEMFSV